jgi:hypothetical protein
MEAKYKWLIGGIVLGIILGPQIQKLPLVNKIPTI